MPKINCHFSGSSNLVKVIYNEMLQAKNVVFVAMFTLTNDTLINGLIELRQKGVKVLAIFDNAQIKNYNDTIIKLTNADIDWRTTGSERESMHNKFMIIDGVKTITGSFNWTYRASKNNENVVIIEDHRTSLNFLDEFNSIWESITSKHYKEKLGQECYNKLQTELKKLQEQDELNLFEKIKKFEFFEEDNKKQKKQIQALKIEHYEQKKQIQALKSDNYKQKKQIQALKIDNYKPIQALKIDHHEQIEDLKKEHKKQIETLKEDNYKQKKQIQALKIDPKRKAEELKAVIESFKKNVKHPK